MQPNHVETSAQLQTGISLFPPQEASYPTYVDFRVCQCVRSLYLPYISHNLQVKHRESAHRLSTYVDFRVCATGSLMLRVLWLEACGQAGRPLLCASCSVLWSPSPCVMCSVPGGLCCSAGSDVPWDVSQPASQPPLRCILQSAMKLLEQRRSRKRILVLRKLRRCVPLP